MENIPKKMNLKKFSIKNNKKGLVDGLEGRKSVELINAIYESVETGGKVHLRFSPKKCKLGVIK